MTRATIKDIAIAAGVSEAAVSFALNDKPGVSADTRSRIRASAEALGWHPNVAARALSADKARAVGLVIARSPERVGSESFFLQLIAGIESALAKLSLALVLQIAPSVDDEMNTYRRWWSERRVDGVLLVDLRTDDPRPEMIAALRMPAVVIGDPGNSSIPGIAIDDTPAMNAIVAHLAEEGHRNIAHVCGPADLAHTRRRIDAFRSATSSLGITTIGSQSTDYSESSGVEATRQLLALPNRPTAIVFDNEILAVSGMSTIHAAGLSVPGDVAIVSWEDHVICTATVPQLTALRRDPFALGRRSAAALLDLLDGKPAHGVDEPTPGLTVRGSTRP
ncbi:LacI family DNA-binding transcriptional regulator [Spelaeicoccus albus]|uniref:DNA-binding LacI/PurR family transcriptional regulator n=1 Tax=Spelaeicoccus albus TaxID=1280376 RepID=A0A7Z0ACJ3_9MICO|nr:LacI family DNA-binding transcriptional regulator [Spelaeicoccus albus]NYI66726.1 DNA-binding LacI/PurR family transcriptional regulator [Spelaeicoccus albus]